MAISNVRLVGLELIRMGPILSSGAMGTALATLSHTVPDSANLIINPAEATQLFTEEAADPDIELITEGLKTIEFASRDMGNDQFIAAFGGTASGTTIWKSSLTAVLNREMSIEVTSKEYNGDKIQFDMPRVSIRGSSTLRFAKLNSGEIAITGTILVPTDGVSSPITRRII